MKLSAEGKLRLAVQLAFFAGIGGFACGAYAQDSTDAGNKSTTLTGVQVTGTRIKQANLTSDSPVTTVTSQEIQFEGTTRAEDLLNNLPQVFADQGGNLSNGATGTATINLRNLGNQRTLVLINGRRLVPGDPQVPVADINFIPAGLIDHVDVLTGGASAVYGADAVAGVVNFVMKKDYEGVSIDFQRGQYWHDNHQKAIQEQIEASGASNPTQFVNPPHSNFDGAGNTVTLMMGVNSGDGKGNITAYATYQHLNPVYESNRDYSACSLAESGANSLVCSGSSTSAVGRFQVFDQNFNQTGDFNIDPATGNTFTAVKSSNNFNFGALNYLQRNDEKYTMGAFGHYDFNKYAQAYTELMFMDDHTNAVIAPSGEFANSAIPVACDGSNPLISSQELTSMCGGSTTPVNLFFLRRNVEGGNRNDDLRHTDYRILLGLKGAIAGDWQYDTYAQQGTSVYSERYLNEFSQRKFQNALDVVADPTSGAPTCASVLNGSDLNCVPYDIWNTKNITPAALAYVGAEGLKEGLNTEQVVSLTATGSVPIIKSPFAKDSLGLAVGTEYRREYLSLTTDQEFTSNDLTGQGGATIGNTGSYDVKEVFVEAHQALAQHQFLADDLSVDAGYRYSDYSSTHATDTYKLEAHWAPIADLKFRGSFNRAVRAPNVVELFQTQSVALDGATDPCAGTPYTGGKPADGQATATAAQCANDPYFAAHPTKYGQITQNPAGQYNGLQGGNLGLDPETAFSYTYGFVLTPQAVKGLTFSVDYFRIKVKGAISQIGADTILNDCYTTGGNCNLVHRDPNTGSLWLGTNGYVVDTTLNTGFQKVSGVDIAADYRLKLTDVGLTPGAGTIAFNFVGTRDIKELHQPDAGNPGELYSCEGGFGLQCGTPVPTWRHKLRMTYTNPWHTNLFSQPTASIAWRYISGVNADQLSNTNAADSRLPSMNYIDIFASIKIYNSYRLRFGMNNVFDRDPPIIGVGGIAAVYGSGNTYPQVYDSLGRYLFAGVTAEF